MPDGGSVWAQARPSEGRLEQNIRFVVKSQCARLPEQTISEEDEKRMDELRRKYHFGEYASSSG